MVWYILLLLFGSLLTASGQTILINNAQIFDGMNEKTITGNGLIEGNLIKQISQSPIATPTGTDAKVIDAKGYF